jgi:N-sulfoglucosamine sulfohydrolase
MFKPSTMKSYLLGIVIGVLCLQGCNTKKEAEKSAPNIVWIMLEDWGYELSCYGAKGIETPFVDQLASEGVRFTNSFCTAPVCSPSRSAMITGFHQNYIDANQHRTQGPGFKKKPLPFGIKPISILLEDAGYFTCLMESQKTDCNFTTERDLFMGKDWSERQDGQPFFAQITFQGTHRKWERDSIDPIGIEEVQLPSYYPDHPMAKRDWANGLEAMQIADRKVGAILQRLKDEGLAENTLVFLIGDNGRCMPRGKQFLYDGGIQVPIIARWPGHIEPGKVSDDMVMTIDVSAAILEAADIDPGYKLHGKNILGDEVADREYVFAARDKMDDTFDAIRAIRSEKYKLIHNLMPERPYLQYNMYKEASYPVIALMHGLNSKNMLEPHQLAFLAAEKPEFELYDIENDPEELVNLADDPAFTAVKSDLLLALNQWRESVNDKGVSEAFRNGGWPSTYPTRPIEEWEEITFAWRDWVYREPGTSVKRPKIRTVYKNGYGPAE